MGGQMGNTGWHRPGSDLGQAQKWAGLTLKGS